MQTWKKDAVAITIREIESYFNSLILNEELSANDANTLTRIDVFSACDIADLAIEKMMTQ